MGAMIPVLAWFGALVLAAPQAESEVPDRSGPRIVHVRIDEPLQAGTQSLIARALREARPGDVFVCELDTPGGPVETMFQIALAIDAAGRNGVETVAWINREASSAGSYLAMSCERLYTVQHATIGSATPIIAAPLGGAAEIPSGDMREKAYSKLRSDFRGWAEAHGYSGALAESMVDREVVVHEVRIYPVDGPADAGPGGTPVPETRLVTDAEYANLQAQGVPVTRFATHVGAGELCNLTGQEAVDLGLAHGIRDTFDDLVLKLGFDLTDVVHVEATRSEELANLLDSIKWLLLVAALIAAYVEFKVPGFGVFGILSIACFAALLFGRYLVGLADALHLVAVGVGVVLIAVELFVLPGQIWPALLGAVLVIGGLVSANVGPLEGLRYDLGRELAFDATQNLILGAFAALAGAWLLARFLPRTPVASRMILQPGDPAGAVFAAATAGADEVRIATGQLGRARTDLRPVGKVALDGDEGREHEARATGTAIDRGQRVRVVEVSVGRLVVEAAEDAPPEAAPAAPGAAPAGPDRPEETG